MFCYVVLILGTTSVDRECSSVFSGVFVFPVVFTVFTMPLLLLLIVIFTSKPIVTC